VNGSTESLADYAPAQISWLTCTSARPFRTLPVPVAQSGVLGWESVGYFKGTLWPPG